MLIVSGGSQAKEEGWLKWKACADLCKHCSALKYKGSGHIKYDLLLCCCALVVFCFYNWNSFFQIWTHPVLFPNTMFFHRKHKRMRTQFSSKIKTNFDFCHTGNTVIPLKKPILHKEERKEICIFFFFFNNALIHSQIHKYLHCGAAQPFSRTVVFWGKGTYSHPLNAYIHSSPLNIHFSNY